MPDAVWNIIQWIVVGLIAGFIARALVPGKDDIGIIRTIIFGMLGSLVGGLIWFFVTFGAGGLHRVGFIGSIIGAIIVLVIYNKVTGRKRVRR